jgi:beta-galactosidase beta subunit
MSPTDFVQLDESEKAHFYKCEQCGQMVDMRQLDDVLFHEDHVHRPDIQYGGSERLGESSL